MANGEPVRFDLATGQVKAGTGERLLLIPLSTLDELASAAGAEVAARLARTMGVSMGRRLAERLGSIDGVRSASIEAFVSELAFEVAVSGWGALSLERWGKAMVLVVDHVAVKERRMIAAMIEGAIEAAVGREVHGVALTGETMDGGTDPVRVLLASEKTAEKARGWTAEGVGAREILARLHAPSHHAPSHGASS
jgi:hypothetical protein